MLASGSHAAPMGSPCRTKKERKVECIPLENRGVKAQIATCANSNLQPKRGAISHVHLPTGNCQQQQAKPERNTYMNAPVALQAVLKQHA